MRPAFTSALTADLPLSYIHSSPLPVYDGATEIAAVEVFDYKFLGVKLAGSRCIPIIIASNQSAHLVLQQLFCVIRPSIF